MNTEISISEEAIHSIKKKKKAKGEKQKVRILQETASQMTCLRLGTRPALGSLCGSGRTDGLGQMRICRIHSPCLTHSSVYFKVSLWLLYKDYLGERIIILDLAKIGEKPAGYSVSSNNLCSNNKYQMDSLHCPGSYGNIKSCPKQRIQSDKPHWKIYKWPVNKNVQNHQ